MRCRGWAKILLRAPSGWAGAAAWLRSPWGRRARGGRVLCAALVQRSRALTPLLAAMSYILSLRESFHRSQFATSPSHRGSRALWTGHHPAAASTLPAA
mmetsp:Transcript_64254/g.88877  ORF Transcript_64254/g.88877 Transcript_64254/m.88877 type:complete len:99 (-) Transcript_64254:622-918(-)